MKINPEKMYSGPEAQKILGIKSRQRIPEYMRNGQLKGEEFGKGVSKRLWFLGSNLQDFLDRKKLGKIRTAKYFRKKLGKIRTAKDFLDRKKLGKIRTAKYFKKK